VSVQADSLSHKATEQFPRAGVIGLGMIGGGVAVSLGRSGRTPMVYDVDPAAVDRLSGETTVAASPAHVAQRSDVVLVAVVDADQVRAVLRGEDGLLAGAEQGLIVVVMSTVAVPEVLDLARECAAKGVALLDCGVTPGDQAAVNGMVAMIGGDDHTVRRAMPVLVDFAKKVVHCGPLGAGMATKIARNVVTYGSWRALHEAAEIAEAAGVNPKTLLSVIEEADPSGLAMSSVIRGRLSDPGLMEEHAPSMLRLMDKDLAAAQDLAKKHDLDVPLVDVVRTQGADTLEIGRGAGSGDAHEREIEDATSSGLKTMAAVYGPQLADAIPQDDLSPTLADTVDHLFGEVWSRPGLSIRDRRLLVIGATAALGRADLIETQVRGALINDELTVDELQELVLQLHYYVGWGNGTSVQEGVNAALQSVEGGA
jgi:3-hydroxyisobutyrate dehydrogenase-like beta-hydroxyacid dehydrogenase/alkylhydroperoxidase/carboxymuconolactone decarboxylase family protein YurZ